MSQGSTRFTFFAVRGFSMKTKKKKKKLKHTRRQNSSPFSRVGTRDQRIIFNEQK